MLTTAALALSLITVLLRAGSTKDRAPLVASLADVTFVLASIAIVLGIAEPEAWSATLVTAPPSTVPVQPLDARMPSHLAYVLALLGSLPAAFAAGRGRWLNVLVPGAMLAVVVTAVVAFFGLRDVYALAATAVGAFAGGVALGAGLRSAPIVGPERWRALLVVAGAALSVASTVALHGPRSDPASLKQDASSSAFGYGLAFRGLADTASSPRRLSVEVQKGMALREYHPALVAGDSGRATAHAAGSRWSGPVVAALEVHEENASAHPFVWLARGDSLVVKDAVLSFRGFRSEKTEGVRFYADLDVRRGGSTTRVSPGIEANSSGSTPFAAEAPGLGPIAVARMDADGGRVALMMAGLPHEPGTLLATLRLQLRPGLDVAWGALALALVAGVLAAATGATHKARASARPARA